MKDAEAAVSEPRPEGRVRERSTAADKRTRPMPMAGAEAAVRAQSAQEASERGGFMTLTLLSRAYCHLCDEMRAAVGPLAAAAGATFTVVDVDAEPNLESAYGDRVPVLFAGEPGRGEELCHFRVDVQRVEAALRRPARKPE